MFKIPGNDANLSSNNTSTHSSASVELATLRGLKSEPQSWTNFEFRKWWKLHQSQFPRIFKIKQRLDCVSVTTLDSEHAFSIASYSVSKYSNRMKPEKLKLRMLSKVNVAPLVKAEIKKTKSDVFKESNLINI